MIRPARARDGRRPGTLTSVHGRALRTPVAWGVVWGGLQAASPLGFFWVGASTVYAVELALIAAIYIGFSVADGRPRVIAFETVVAAACVVLAAVG